MHEGLQLNDVVAVAEGDWWFRLPNHPVAELPHEMLPHTESENIEGLNP